MPRDMHTIREALDGMPILDRVATLAAHLIAVGEAPQGIAFLVSTALTMAQHLPVSERARIVWLLEEAAAELRARARWQ